RSVGDGGGSGTHEVRAADSRRIDAREASEDSRRILELIPARYLDDQRHALGRWRPLAHHVGGAVAATRRAVLAGEREALDRTARLYEVRAVEDPAYAAGVEPLVLHRKRIDRRRDHERA